MLIDASNSGYGIATELEEVEVANPFAQQSIAILQKGIKRL